MLEPGSSTSSSVTSSESNVGLEPTLSAPTHFKGVDTELDLSTPDNQLGREY